MSWRKKSQLVILPDWVILGKAPNQVLPFSQENNSLPTIEVRLDDLEVTVLNTEVRIFLQEMIYTLSSTVKPTGPKISPYCQAFHEA